MHIPNNMQVSIIIWYFLLFKTCIAKLEPLSTGFAELRYSIASCILTTAKEFSDNHIITITLSSKDFSNYTNSVVVTDQLLLSEIHHELRWTTLVRKSGKLENQLDFFKKSDEYIIQLRDADEFENILLSLTQMSSWNPHANFIIITTTVFSDRQKVIEKVFKNFWNKMVLNAIIMLPRNAISGILDIYSWFPFHNGHCGDSFDGAYIINECNYGVLKINNSLFPEKIPKDMNQCPISVRAVIWPPYVIGPLNLDANKTKIIKLNKGIEIMLLNTVAEVANFNIIYSVSNVKQDWGFLYKNGTATGMMYAVISGEVDIGVGAIASLDLRHTFFDPSISYIWESVTWCVPHAVLIPKWKCLIRIFYPSLWFFILIVYLVVSLSTWILTNQEKFEISLYKKPQFCFQNILSMMLGLTVKTLPRTTRIRLLIMVWVIVSLHLNAAFTSSLIRELTQPSFEKQISSVAEMKEKGFSFGVVPPTARFFTFEGKYYYTEISSWINCNDVKLCLDRTAYDRNFAVGIPRMYMQYASQRYLTKNGRYLLYWMSKDIASYPVEMIMTKGFPLLKRINEIISRIKEAGLLAKWQYDFLEKADDNITISISYDDTEEVILTEVHLEGAFILLSIGSSVATITFICEVIIYRNKRK